MERVRQMLHRSQAKERQSYRSYERLIRPDMASINRSNGAGPAGHTYYNDGTSTLPTTKSQKKRQTAANKLHETSSQAQWGRRVALEVGGDVPVGLIIYWKMKGQELTPEQVKNKRVPSSDWCWLKPLIAVDQLTGLSGVAPETAEGATQTTTDVEVTIERTAPTEPNVATESDLSTTEEEDSDTDVLLLDCSDIEELTSERKITHKVVGRGRAAHHRRLAQKAKAAKATAIVTPHPRVLK